MEKQEIERWRYEWMAERKDKYYEEAHRLANEVVALGERLKEIEVLCGEILATLNLAGNKQIFAELPPSWHELVELWTQRWQKD